MDISLHWEKTLFVNRFAFYIKKNKVGALKFSFLNQNAEGNLLKARIRFRKKNWFSNKTDIIDTSSGLVIGGIIMKKGLIWNKAEVIFEGNTYTWEQTSLFSGKWELSAGEVLRVGGKNNSLRGQLMVVDAQVPLILSSFFIARKFKDTNSLFTLIIALPPVIKFLFSIFG